MKIVFREKRVATARFVQYLAAAKNAKGPTFRDNCMGDNIPAVAVVFRSRRMPCVHSTMADRRTAVLSVYAKTQDTIEQTAVGACVANASMHGWPLIVSLFSATHNHLLVLLPPRRRLYDQFGLSVILSARRITAKVLQPISFKLGVNIAIGPTNRQN